MSTQKYRAVARLTLADGKVVEPGAYITKPDKWLVDQGLVVQEEDKK